MIKIGKPYILLSDKKAILAADIEISEVAALKYKSISESLKKSVWRTDKNYPPKEWKEKKIQLTYETDIVYADYLCKERSDAFVIAMFWYGMVTGEDIGFEAPLSRKLYEGLVQKLIPALSQKSYRAIRLIGPISEEKLKNKGGIGVGMSAGVDSFYSLRTHKEVTHLAYYEAGHIFHLNGVLENPSIEEYYKAAYELADKRAEVAADIAKQSGKEFVYVKSNLDENFYRGGMIYRSMYCSLSCTLALQKLFGRYISSSSGHHGDLEINLIAPTQNYENLICESCKTETMDYVSSDFEGRITKIQLLAEDELMEKYLEVCFNFSGHNCGKCYGCLKTMIALDLIGKLDNYNQVFELKEYYENRKMWIRMVAEATKRPELSSIRAFWAELVDFAKENKSQLGDVILEQDKRVNERPFFSVVVSTYNIEKYVSDCIESIKAQTFGNYECIVVDDGSSDGTAEVVKQSIGEDSRFRLLQMEHKGPGAVRNTGLKEAVGHFVMFIDGDDTLNEKCLQDCAERSAGKDLLIFGINYYEYRDENLLNVETRCLKEMEFASGAELADWYIENHKLLLYSVANKCYKLDVLKNAGIRFKEETDFGEDRLLNYDFLQCCGRIGIMSSAYYNYRRINEASLTKSFRTHHMNELLALHKAKMGFVEKLSSKTNGEKMASFKKYDICKTLSDAFKHLTGQKNRISEEERMKELEYLTGFRMPDYFYGTSGNISKNLIDQITHKVFEKDEDLEIPKVDTVVVMGSKSCEYRVEKALKTFGNVRYICCGKNMSQYKASDGTALTEAEFMRNYLLDHGITNVVMENESKNTIENIKNAVTFITSEERVAVVTAGFHKKRVEKLLEEYGLKWDVISAYGPNTTPENWYTNNTGIDAVIREYEGLI